MTPVTRATPAGRAYLDLQNRAHPSQSDPASLSSTAAVESALSAYSESSP
jgi:hypothetical protein